LLFCEPNKDLLFFASHPLSPSTRFVVALEDSIVSYTYSIPSKTKTMTLFVRSLFFVVAAACVSHFSKAEVVLSEQMVHLAMVSAQLSAMAYEEHPPRNNAFDSFGFYDQGMYITNKKNAILSCLVLQISSLPSIYLSACITIEPDQAIVAKKDGYCFAAFRGTTMTWMDWQQNFALGMEQICQGDGDVSNGDSNNGGSGLQNCCSTRSGFYNAYMTSYREDMEKAIRLCANDCASLDECVVFTGHSQGGDCCRRRSGHG
jgi:hypothetical protein